MIIMDPKCVPIPDVEGRSRYKRVDIPIALIIAFGARHPLEQGVQCRPQYRIRKTSIIAGIVRLWQV